MSVSASSSSPVTARLPERGNGEREDLLGGAVVDRQPLAAPAYVDADTRQRDVVVVDPLVHVADDEHVVRPGRHGGTQQPPLRGVQVLRLVDDHVPVGQLHRAVAERTGGLVGELRERVPAERAQPASTRWVSAHT